MPIRTTRFGNLDALMLEKVCDSFDTGRLFRAIEQLELTAGRITELRHDLRRLYDMASKLLEEDAFLDTPAALECKPGHEIWALAEDISMSMTEWPEHIETVQAMLDDLTTLAPDPDEYDYITNKAYE